MSPAVKRLLTLLVLAMVVVGGCTQLYDLWPTKAPHDLLKYTDRDPNLAPQTLGGVKELRESAVTKHILQQIDYKHEMEKDKALYDRALAQVDRNITTAQNERTDMIGTLQQPGWLLGALLGLTGVGAYFAGYRTKRPEDYDEQEFQTAIRDHLANTGSNGNAHPGA